MSNISKVFENGKAFIAFVTSGDPSLEITEQLVYAMDEAGADLVELGIPFSDPTAEGPVIQEANIRALSGGVTTDKIFDMVRRIRKRTQIPMVFMTYANVVFSYGTERFIKTAAQIGMDGLILPDIPYEEKDEFRPVCEKYGLSFISLIAPTSHDRIRMIAKEADGFVYCVSSLGVTGVRSRITTDVGAMVKLVKEENRGLDKVQALFADMGERTQAWTELREVGGLELVGSLKYNIEINAAGVNKGTGLVNLGKMLGIKRGEIMAFGDGDNDIVMLKEVGIGVAMANAEAKVKEAADYITMSNEEDGVAEAIEKLVLQA